MKIAIFGCGGLGRVAAESVIRTGIFELAGFLDDSPQAPDVVDGVAVLGPRGEIERIRRQSGIEGFVVALGNNALRVTIAEDLIAAGLQPVSLIDATAVVSPTARLGEGVVIAARCVIGPAAEIGRFSVVNTAAVIEHDATIGPGCYIGPASLIEARATVAEAACLPGRSFVDKDASRA